MISYVRPERRAESSAINYTKSRGPVDYTHPGRRSSVRVVPAGQPIVLQAGESVVLGTRRVVRTS